MDDFEKELGSDQENQEGSREESVETRPASEDFSPEVKEHEIKSPDSEAPKENSSKGLLAGILAIILLVAAFSILNDDGVGGVVSNNSNENNKPSARAIGAAVLTAVSNQEVGDFLVDENGMTLYVRDGDCTDSCLNNWPPYLYDGEPALGDLGLVPRKDTGELQYTYNDNLLYYYVGDEAPGETNGHGQNGWSVVRPN